MSVGDLKRKDLQSAMSYVLSRLQATIRDRGFSRQCDTFIIRLRDDIAACWAWWGVIAYAHSVLNQCCPDKIQWKQLLPPYGGSNNVLLARTDVSILVNPDAMLTPFVPYGESHAMWLHLPGIYWLDKTYGSHLSIRYFLVETM